MGHRKTQEVWDNEVHNLVGNEYTFLQPYINNTTKLKVKHNKCGRIYKITPKQFLKGVRCKKCVMREIAKKHTKTNEQFIKEVFLAVGNEYTVLDKYKNSSTKVTIRHNICGTEYKVRPDAFLRGTRCKKCLYKRYSKEYKKTTKEFSDEVKKVTNNEYELVGAYMNVNSKVQLKHNACGTVYTVFPYQFIRGRRCPSCNQSKGEKLVEASLNELSIVYESQKKFYNLRDINALSYDFYLPEYDTLIEYQGLQHFEPIDLFGGVRQFKIQKNHDEIKRNYARKNKYVLIEIPYTKDTYYKVKEFLIKNISLQCKAENLTPNRKAMI